MWPDVTANVCRCDRYVVPYVVFGGGRGRTILRATLLNFIDFHFFGSQKLTGAQKGHINGHA